MTRPMRRKRQQLPKEECVEILKRCTCGVLALEGDGSYPYAVPLSYVYSGGAVYFHCAKEGYKTDCIKRNEKVSFCVVAQDEIIPEKFTTEYKSVIVFGRAHIIENPDEMLKAARLLAGKYSPGETAEAVNEEIEKFWPSLAIIRLDIENFTGKEGSQLALRRSKGKKEE